VIALDCLAVEFEKVGEEELVHFELTQELRLLTRTSDLITKALALGEADKIIVQVLDLVKPRKLVDEKRKFV